MSEYAARVERLRTGDIPPTFQHGASAAENWGCKCETCATAVRAKRRARYLARKARAERISRDSRS